MKVPNIRFNLKFYAPDGSDIVIRTLADLEANLNLSDLWDYFKAGDLARWLRSVGETAKADSLEKLNQGADGMRNLLGEVCRILQLSVPEQEIAVFVEMEERRKNRIEQQGTEVEEAIKESYVELVRGLIKNKFDILLTHKIMIKMLNHYPDSFVRDFVPGKFADLPCVNLLCQLFDDAWKQLLSGGSGWGHLSGDAYGHHFSYWWGCGNQSLGTVITDDGTGCLDSAFEVIEAGYNNNGCRVFDGRHVFCSKENRGVVLKQKMIERLQEQDVMHDFVFTHN